MPKIIEAQEATSAQPFGSPENGAAHWLPLIFVLAGAVSLLIDT